MDWSGQFKRKQKNPTVLLEEITGGELLIWGCINGHPGSINDINIIDSSAIIRSILEGTMLPSFENAFNG